MLIDSHVHVGQFYEMYHTPTSVIKLMADVGVDYYAVSSTTTCEENFEKVLHEIEELVWNDEGKVLPVMWITPDSLNGNIGWLIDSNIKWKCVKVHPFLHPNDWDPRGEQFSEVIDIVTELNVPLLIHTGNDVSCHAGKYEELIAMHPNTNFILAHGRPINETVYLIRHYDNVYSDSAFMTIEDMKKIVDEGLSEKLLWGTDMMIPIHSHPKEDMMKYYHKKLQLFGQVCANDDYEKVIWENSNALFLLNLK